MISLLENTMAAQQTPVLPQINTEHYVNVCRYALKEICGGQIPSWINVDEAAEEMAKYFKSGWPDFQRDILEEWPDSKYDFCTEIQGLIPCRLHEKECLEVDISQFYTLSLHTVAPGLAIATYPGVTAALKRIYNSYTEQKPWQQDQTWLDKRHLIPWNGLGGETGRDSFISTASVEELVPTWSEALATLAAAHQAVLDHYIRTVPALQDAELGNTISVHAYRSGAKTPKHKDFGLVASSFTLGNGFEYSPDGRIWVPVELEHDQFIVNLGMYAQCVGLNAILHRVFTPDVDPLDERYSKFTVGFFSDVQNTTHLPMKGHAGRQMRDQFATPMDYLSACLDKRVDVSGDAPELLA